MKNVLIAIGFMLGLAACGESAVPAEKPAEQAVSKTAEPAEEKSLAAAPQARPPVVITSTDLGDGIHMIEGRGGNIGLLTGPDGAYVIDSQFDDIAEHTLAKIAELSGGAPQYLINTHWHGDHAGGNVAYHAQGAQIVAHDNVLRRMSTDNESSRFGNIPPSPEEARPTITYADQKSLTANGQTIRLIHYPHAHTDGDTIVFFEEANVLHMGDIMFAGRFPFIDLDSGGSVAGYLAALEGASSLCTQGTKVMPGHGPLSTCNDIDALADMLRESKSRIETLVVSGETLDQVVDAAPLNDFAQDWAWGFINEPIFTTILYNDLSRSSSN